MAFLKYATAQVVRPQVSGKAWGKMRKASVSKGELSTSLIDQATEVLGESFDPAKYLLTHCTIVASVDVESVPNVKLGSVTEDGQKIMRKYSDYRVTTETQKFANHNFDCWSREVLLKSYKTFVGGHNFCEHVQLEELSKGRIIDAVARDIGPSVYVDILVATDRKHTQLIEDILSGKMSTLSMGCLTDETCCTYCGHVAADETELCKHIRFMKGSTFYDDKGRKNVIGELCGHSSLDPHGGVKFIEASWVETPAFTGAVLRNVLEAEKVSPEVIKKAELVLASPPPQWMADKYQKAANVLKTLAKNAEWGDPEEGGGDEPAADPAAPAAPSGPDPFSDLEKDIQTMVMDKVRQKVRDKLNEDKAVKLTPENSTAKPNDNIVKQANRDMAYRAAVLAIARTASSDIEFMEKLAQYNVSVGIDVPAAIYRSTLKVGGKDNMVLLHNFVKSCRVAIGRMPKNSGTQTLMRLGNFLSKREVN